jgi:hypothetical protein
MLSEGTRVVVLRVPQRSGCVTEVRFETYLRPYVVRCDEGGDLFVSAWELALESDPSKTPLVGPIEF